jgi:hypothetical protein
VPTWISPGTFVTLTARLRPGLGRTGYDEQKDGAFTGLPLHPGCRRTGSIRGTTPDSPGDLRLHAEGGTPQQSRPTEITTVMATAALELGGLLRRWRRVHHPARRCAGLGSGPARAPYRVIPAVTSASGFDLAYVTTILPGTYILIYPICSGHTVR